MNIYFDFEATQYSDHIIAIGASCLTSDYQNFFCLVSSFANKMTPFITELTGITKEDLLTNGIEADEAFVKLWHWIRRITSMSDEPIFYHCYGDGDKNFLRKTADKIKDRYVAEFVNNLAESLIDDSKAVCRYFHTKAVGVFKALRYFEPDYPEQTHNPLQDAIALLNLIEHIREAKPLLDCPFIEGEKKEKEPSFTPQNYYYITAFSTTDVCMKPRFFNSYGEAADWLTTRMKRKNPEVKRENVLKRMKNAVDNEKEYAYFNWTKTIVRKETDNDVE